MTLFLNQLSIIVRYILYCRATPLPRVLSYLVRTVDTFVRNKKKNINKYQSYILRLVAYTVCKMMPCQPSKKGGSNQGLTTK